MRVQRARVGVGTQIVEGKPRSARGERTVALTPEVVSVLQTWRKAQAVMSFDGYVFTRDGQPIHPDVFSRAFNTAQEAFRAEHPEAPRLRFHDMRRTAGSVWIVAGVAPVVVSRMLGHASVSFTLDVYVSVLPDQTADAAARMASVPGS